VRLAEQAAADGKNAKTRTDWLNLAYRWQQASDLMNRVPPEDQRYTTAQDRVTAYRKNSEAALDQANQPP
jgi:putative SOS response-associated peptidase YedK